jgi:alkanesulfonate monooxygenase SsuD/methylene tetrahydromethanopterin reductase-like flavin-dependent oxidoreductase (luciferase family)
MKYGFVIPSGDVHTIVELVSVAEEAGWDGVFYWDGMCYEPPRPIYDPWVVLAAIAAHTRHVRIGPLIAVPSRRRPWQLAREVMTLDHLSAGRVILAVGLGWIED